jgi:hypothetical protein
VSDETDAVMIGEPMTDYEMDTIENCAQVVIEAVRVGDWDTAYIAASTALNPGMLAMFIAEMMIDDGLD